MIFTINFHKLNARHCFENFIHIIAKKFITHLKNHYLPTRVCESVTFSHTHTSLMSLSIFLFQINLKLILVSGKTKEFLFSPSESAGDIAQHVFDNWPEGEINFSQKKKNHEPPCQLYD